MRKKIISICAVALVCFYSIGMNFSSIYAQKIMPNDVLNKCNKIGESFLFDYYYAIDMKQDLDVTEYINDNDVSEYVELKQEVMKNRIVKSGCNITDFSVEISCFNHQVVDSGIEMIFNVLIKHQYSGCDVMSESMQQVKLGFQNEDDEIKINNYFEFTDFDKNISLQQNQETSIVSRMLSVNASEEEFGNYIDFNKNTTNLVKLQLAEETEFFDSANGTTESVNEFSNDEQDLLEDKSINIQGTKKTFINSSLIRAQSVSLSARSKMVTYANANCSKVAPSSGNSSIAKYYDFSELSNAFDCTNFASHCLLAGGAVENHNAWYYDKMSSRSASWAGVNQFHDFITKNSKVGPKADARTLAYNCTKQYVNWDPGDFIQIKYKNYNYPNFGHTTIVTGKYAKTSSSYIPMITSRTGDNNYNKNEILTVKYPISSNVLAYRLIHITDFK